MFKYQRRYEERKARVHNYTILSENKSLFAGSKWGNAVSARFRSSGEVNKRRVAAGRGVGVKVPERGERQCRLLIVINYLAGYVNTCVTCTHIPTHCLRHQDSSVL